MVGVSAGNRWSRYIIISLCVHGLLVSIPVSMVVRERITPIAVSLITQPAPLPEERKIKPPPAKAATPKPAGLNEKPAAQRPEEPKDVKAQIVSPGEEKVMRVAPGVGDAQTGVAIAGARVAGTGSVGTAIGGSMPGGTGKGAGYGYGGEPRGPVDTQFGKGDGPRFVYRQMPEYPFAARRLGKEGRVVLEVIIDEKGALEKVEVLEASDRIFVEPAVDSIKKSRFQSARSNGSPFKARCTMLIRFGFAE